ncbi:MAG: hypothetical protein WBE78_00175 [Candidatus Binataceae bacterium]
MAKESPNATSTETPAADPLESTYTVRRLTPADAQEIPALATRVNGPSYIHAEVYHPDRLLELNAKGELVSVVALDKAGEVVGHCALERPHLTVVAETGEAMVLPEHRRHHLLDRMHGYLEGLASALGVLGLSSDAVTHHIYSQRTCERFNSHPTGIVLGSLPPSADNLQGVYPQRLSFIDYFKYVSAPPPAQAFLAEHHQAIATRIFGLLGRKVSFGEHRSPSGAGVMETSYEADKQRAKIAVTQPGAETADQIRAARGQFLNHDGAEEITVELPLSNPAAPPLAAELERQGFFFTGLRMRDPSEGDLVRFQYLKSPLDFALIKLDGTFAIELLKYIDDSRRRVITEHLAAR